MVEVQILQEQISVGPSMGVKKAASKEEAALKHQASNIFPKHYMQRFNHTKQR